MKSKVVFLNISFLIFAIISFLVINQYIHEFKFVIYGIGLLSIFLMIIIIYSWFKLNGSILNIFLIFILCMIVFNFGQFIAMVLNGFDIETLNSYKNTLVVFPAEVLLKASKIAFFSIFCFNFGGVLFSKVTKENERREINLSYCKYIGIALFLLCIIPLFIYDVSYIMQSIDNGYNVSSLSVNYGFIDDLARTFKVAIIYLLLGYKDNIKIAKFIYCTSVIYSIFKIWIIGQRGYEFIFVLVLTFIYYKYITKLNFRKILKVFIFIITLFSLMNSLVYIRETTEKVDLSRIFENIVKKNIVIEVLSEFGSSFYTTEIIAYEVPSGIQYSYGEEIFSSVLTVFPNVNNLNEYLKEISISQQLLRKGYIGIGGSLVGELYYNFSYLIYIISLIIGGAIFKIATCVLSKKGYIDFFKVAITISLYQNLIWIIRDSVMSLPRKCVFELFVPFLIFTFLRYIKLKNPILRLNDGSKLCQ